MTDIEILTNSINTLNNISVPVPYTEQIAIPMYNVASMLTVLLKAIQEKVNEQKQEPEETKEEEN